MKVDKRINKILRMLNKEKRSILLSGQVTEFFRFLEAVTSQITTLQVEHAYESKNLEKNNTTTTSPLFGGESITKKNTLNRGQLNLKAVNYRRKVDSLKRQSPEITENELELILINNKKELEESSEIEWIDNLPFLKKVR